VIRRMAAIELRGKPIMSWKKLLRFENRAPLYIEVVERRRKLKARL